MCLLVICLRLSTLGFAKHMESFQLDRLDLSQRIITVGFDTAACKIVVPANHFAAHEFLVLKDFLLGCAHSTIGQDKVYDQGKRILCTLDGTRNPMAVESSKVNSGHDGCGRRVCFGPQRQGFSFDP